LGIGDWGLGNEGDELNQFAIRFFAMTLSTRC
jgi:hypothetical protein